VERARIEYDEAGLAVRLVGVNMDVTDLRQAQEARDESEARFRAFMDNSPFKAWIKDDRGHYLFLNRAGLRYKRRADYVGTVLADHFPPETAAYMRRTDRIVLETGAPYRFVEQVSEGGEPRDYLTVKFPIVRGEVQLVAGVSVDVTDQRRAERALERAGEQKDRFLATLSHELRNPLAPIRNAVSLLKAAESDPARVAWSREIIERQVNHLVHLIDDLLDISRITRDKLQLRRETVALGDVIGAAVESVRPLFEQRGQELAVAEAPAPVIVDVDPTRLAQVVANLLSNASKYTPPGGRIDLRIAVKRDEIVIRVRDTGIGIAAEHVPHLFEMFYQVPGSDAEVQGGLGIGLALVRELVRLHGGRVSAESPGPGQGATFTVVLPRTIGTPRRGALRPGARAGLAGARNCRVLVADDNRDAADSLALVLALMGYTVKTVYDGAAAVEEVDAFAPDVAVLDIGMPQMNGYLAAEAIRAGGKSVVLVALTGWGQQADREKAAAAGFDHHFTKPVDAEALGAFLDRITRERPVRAPGG
jgi:PAS domain S-box-containing protein